jgi:hypothetical protein
MDYHGPMFEEVGSNWNEDFREAWINAAYAGAKTFEGYNIIL